MNKIFLPFLFPVTSGDGEHKKTRFKYLKQQQQLIHKLKQLNDNFNTYKWQNRKYTLYSKHQVQIVQQ